MLVAMLVGVGGAQFLPSTPLATLKLAPFKWLEIDTVESFSCRAGNLYVGGYDAKAEKFRARHVAGSFFQLGRLRFEIEDTSWMMQSPTIDPRWAYIHRPMPTPATDDPVRLSDD